MEKENVVLNQLFTQKGQITTEIEILQNRLKQINDLIVKELQKPKQPVIEKKETNVKK